MRRGEARGAPLCPGRLPAHLAPPRAACELGVLFMFNCAYFFSKGLTSDRDPPAFLFFDYFSIQILKGFLTLYLLFL